MSKTVVGVLAAGALAAAGVVGLNLPSDPVAIDERPTVTVMHPPMQQPKPPKQPLPPPPPEPKCNPNYSGCLKPNASDYDCAGGSGNGPYYTGKVRVIGYDQYDLDRDNDGWACE